MIGNEAVCERSMTKPAENNRMSEANTGKIGWSVKVGTDDSKAADPPPARMEPDVEGTE